MDLFIEENNITKLVATKPPKPAIEDGYVLMAVEKFVLTSNIVSYATAGESLGYFKFFPMKNGTRIPSWGYGTVIISKVDGINVGDKFYGFYAMSKYVKLKPSKMSDSSFIDLAEHRKDLSLIYNTYQLCSKVDFYRQEFEDLTIILRPLYLTGWLLADFVDDNKNFDAAKVIITSASSKTSIGLAHELQLKGKFRTIGLTSTRNVEFVQSLNLYDEIVAYDDIKSLAPSDTYTIIDMAGNRPLISSIQDLVRDNLKYICAVGNTHWTEKASEPKFEAKVKPVFFFAPAQSAKRINEWGSKKLVEALDAAWLVFVKACSDNKWLTVAKNNGADAVIESYARLSAGTVSPREAIICSLWKEGEMQADARL